MAEAGIEDGAVDNPAVVKALEDVAGSLAEEEDEDRMREEFEDPPASVDEPPVVLALKLVDDASVAGLEERGD